MSTPIDTINTHNNVHQNSNIESISTVPTLSDRLSQTSRDRQEADGNNTINMLLSSSSLPPYSPETNQNLTSQVNSQVSDVINNQVPVTENADILTLAELSTADTKNELQRLQKIQQLQIQKAIALTNSTGIPIQQKQLTVDQNEANYFLQKDVMEKNKNEKVLESSEWNGNIPNIQTIQQIQAQNIQQLQHMQHLQGQHQHQHQPHLQQHQQQQHLQQQHQQQQQQLQQQQRQQQLQQQLQIPHHIFQHRLQKKQTSSHQQLRQSDRQQPQFQQNEPESFQTSPVTIPNTLVFDSSANPLTRHSVTKLFVCNHPGCNKTFSRKLNYVSHYRSAHEHQKPFKCEQCEKCFARHSDRRRHEKSQHSQNKSFVCHGILENGISWGCGKKFKRKDGLTAHWKSLKAKKKCFENLTDDSITLIDQNIAAIQNQTDVDDALQLTNTVVDPLIKDQ